MDQKIGTTPQRADLPLYGINRDRLDDLFRNTGGTVQYLRRTGEVAYLHPALPERPRANGRRKDAPAHLVRFVRRVMQVQGVTNRGLTAAPCTREN